jgi:hypothetical protein
MLDKGAQEHSRSSKHFVFQREFLKKALGND